MQRSCHGVVMARPPTLGTYHREEQGRGIGRTGFIDQCLHTLTARPAVCTPKVLASLRLPQRHRVLAQAPSMPLPDLRKKRGNGIWQGEAGVSREVVRSLSSCTAAEWHATHRLAIQASFPFAVAYPDRSERRKEGRGRQRE